MTLQEHFELLTERNAEYHKDIKPLLLAKQTIERQKKTNKDGNPS